MSLEQFKTQVLLLHSEQSALDELSAGFGDRYTVHCATSGSEALNTLGDIQIDVIVTTQSLPGMSGLDALREAKKRSPDTIGILLAGSDGDEIEALVGDEEVFQVVRGNVTRSSLKALIDGATRQARLIALAESANDTAANVDVPIAEHIVMETSENGSAIISDGTGRLPKLDPKKISAAADIGARAVDVLVLTQDDEFLATIRDSARGLHNVIYTNTLAQADDAVRKHKIGVAVIDAAMVGSNVEKLTMHLRLATPRLVAIVAGRRDDGEMLMDLINRGKVYRFLLKPVSPGRSRLAIEASVKHHLEAPDSAFAAAGKPKKFVPKAQPKAAPKLVPKPKPAPQPAPKAKKKTQPPPKPAAVTEKRKVTAAPRVRVVPNPKEALSPIENRPRTASAGNKSSMLVKIVGAIKMVARIVMGTIALFRKMFSAIGRLTAASSGGSLIAKLKLMAIAAVAVTAVAAALYWKYSGPNEPLSIAESLVETPPIFETDTQLGTETTEAIEVTEVAEVAEAIDNELLDQALKMAETALLEQRVEDILAKANSRLSENRLVAPSNDNARYYFELARSNDPKNAAARQGLLIVADQLLLQARTQINEENFDIAEALLADARGLDPSSNELATLTVALQASRDHQAQLQREAALALAKEASAMRAETAAATEKPAAAKLPAEAPVELPVEAPVELPVEAPAEPVAVAQETVVDKPEPATQEVEAVVEQQASEEEAIADPVVLPAVIASPVPVSSLTRTKYVAPRYPRAAQRRGMSGWVDVVLTVDIDGTVAEVVVSGSTPGTMFVDSATKAVEGWKFEPVIENGVAVQKRAAVRMMFAIE